MTIILTQISKYGILHASDSNLTSGEGHVEPGVKVFPIPRMNAGLSIAGVFSVNGQRMDHWMPEFIAAQEIVGTVSLSDFAHNLKEDLQSQMASVEKERGSLIHIAGYAVENEQTHPEFWFVRNIHDLDLETGEYKNIRDDFIVSEDFWHRDCKKNNSQIAFEKGHYQLYINGYTSGRVSYMILQNALRLFFNAIWQNPNWKFRPPQSLEEAEAFVKLYIQCVGTLFGSSDYPAPYIGGNVQTYSIPAPQNTKLNC